MTETVDAAIDDRFDRYRETLDELLAQPSISSQGVGMEACMDLLSSILAEYGFDPETIPTVGYPLVYAEEIVDETAPTVLFYGHYDVQPPGDKARWESPPFEPTVRDGAVYARGSGDNKGQLLTHVFAADAIRRAEGELPVNVKLLFEGEEENGSTGLIDYLSDGPEKLDADLVYVADGPMHPSRRPTLLYGNRGLLSFELSLRRADADLHSGNFGGPVPNPANELVAVLASMYSGTEIEIEGVHDAVNVTDADRKLVRDIPLDAEAMRRDLGLDAFTVPPEEYYGKLLLEPSLTINGIRSGYGGEGMKTIVPHQATAKVDMRLVPDQDPDRIFERVETHVDGVNPNVAVEKLGTFPPMKTPLDTPAAAHVKGALEEVWGTEVVEMPLLGGSLPAAYFKRLDDVPVLVVPYANPDQGNHSPNEHLDVACFENGIRTSAAFIRRFADR